jgi:maltose alpha-D-glucosyltransferase/alpha-amylase
MAYHFPLMPRIYMAVAEEDNYPIVDILSQTPDIPNNCQWAIFLRNHDELTLEMVTDEERDYMYREYARDPRMRINVGIRRRLSPLMESGRRQIELMNALLMSMPGTPIIYYGDEIGMGDNIYLGDRNGVRTPMQWSSDRNAGFSEADTAALFSPLIVDPPYGYHTVNVVAQERVPTSLLRWMRRLINVRQEYQAFGRGTWEPVDTANRRVLVFLRRYRDETILCVNNLSRFAQYVELDLREFAGLIPLELWSKNAFPPVGELPYLLTLGPHNFLWFRLIPAEQAKEYHRRT